MKRLFPLLLAVLLASCATPRHTAASAPEQTVYILFENDVHGSIQGYPLMASLKKSLMEQTPMVAVVSCGDHLSGSPYAAMGKGTYITRLMKAVGYDYVTLGNHEFDHRIPTLLQRTQDFDTNNIAVLCANFTTMEGNGLFAGSATDHFGGTAIAFIGLTTPDAITSSTPSYFCDSLGNWRYSFNGDRLAQLLQHQVDSLQNLGIRHIVLLAHLGDDATPALIAATQGIEVVLDGHSHTVIPGTKLKNKLGKEVLWASTGAHFQNIGLLTFSNGKFGSKLIPADEIEPDSALTDTLNAIIADYNLQGRRHIGSTPVPLQMMGDDGRPLSRMEECNLGDFCTDAFRLETGADIGLINGGSIRANMAQGEIAFHQLYSALPFDSRITVAQVSGQTLLDALEMACHRCPEKFGGFLQVSGLRFVADTRIASPVSTDAEGFMTVGDGMRRVRNVEVLDKETGQYAPLDPARLYTVAAPDYTLQLNGDGLRFDGIKVLRDRICTYEELVEQHLQKLPQQQVPAVYGAPQARITLIY